MMGLCASRKSNTSWMTGSESTSWANSVRSQERAKNGRGVALAKEVGHDRSVN